VSAISPPGLKPPNAKAAVFVPTPVLAPVVLKSLTSVQLVPFQVSVAPVKLGDAPPKAKAAV